MSRLPLLSRPSAFAHPALRVPAPDRRGTRLLQARPAVVVTPRSGHVTGWLTATCGARHPSTFKRDWKKLTFYYFADAYINFNSLVTELFKVYKTRIWMSAINPASFASVSPALHAPGGLGYGRQSPYRQQHRDAYYGNNNNNNNNNNSGSGNGNHGAAPLDGFQAPFVPSAETSPVDVAGMNGFPTQFSYGFQPFAPAQRPTGAAMDALAYGIPRMPDRPIEFRPVEFGDLRNDHVRRPAEHDSREPPMVPHEPWMTNFQGLSLGTH